MINTDSSADLIQGAMSSYRLWRMSVGLSFTSFSHCGDNHWNLSFSVSNDDTAFLHTFLDCLRSRLLSKETSRSMDPGQWSGLFH